MFWTKLFSGTFDLILYFAGICSWGFHNLKNGEFNTKGKEYRERPNVYEIGCIIGGSFMPNVRKTFTYIMNNLIT